jgi:nucleotide-binding universal stress UspA family protein
MGPANVANAELDPEAQALFAHAVEAAEAAGVKVHCLYAVAWDIAEAILEIVVTHGVDVLILGATQRGSLWHVMKGDVIQEVAQYLPERINLLIHA